MTNAETTGLVNASASTIRFYVQVAVRANPRLCEEYHAALVAQAPPAGKLKKSVMRPFGPMKTKFEYSLDVESIAGPGEMPRLGRPVVARLKLDRFFYSPTRDKQLLAERTEYIARKKAKDTAAFTGNSPPLRSRVV